MTWKNSADRRIFATADADRGPLDVAPDLQVLCSCGGRDGP